MTTRLPSDLKRHRLEASLTEDTRNWLSLQLDVAFYKASDRYTIGVSDFIICVRGIMVCAELKADMGTPSPQQLSFIRAFEQAGAVCGVCYTLGDVKDLVDKARSMR
jgi:hypothetical protein